MDAPKLAAPPLGYTTDPARALVFATAQRIMASLGCEWLEALRLAEPACAKVKADMAAGRFPKPAAKPTPAKLAAAPARPVALAAASGASRTFRLAAPVTRYQKGFSGVAYSGGALDGGVAIDLSTMHAIDGRVPVLRGHDPNRVVGHCLMASQGTSLVVREGSFSEVTPDGKEISALMREGQPFTLAIAVSGRTERKDPAKPTYVNGRSLRLSGVVTGARLLEVSIVPTSGSDPHATLDRAA